ncbi:MAG TPA: M20/M25/M40 family metallo-hydrolase [Spirochaetia bacterium]|nr:M20/M25/M40 family metallo-hydrolase [Spirochaetia bacterium]
MKEIIRKLTECYGPSGHEEEVRALILSEVEKTGRSSRALETKVDPLGSLIVRRKGAGGGRRVMLAAHMDEIGVVVTHVDQKGFLRFGSVGGVRLLPLAGGRVRFAGGVTGVIGLEKLEDNGKIPALDKFYIDVGAAGRDSCPVKVGDVGCFSRPCEEMGDRIVAKAMDDRIGCAVLLQVLKELGKTPHDISFVFTVQEEVGLRGAVTSGYGAEPEIALAVDVTLTGDTPECPPMAVELGAGPAIKIKDGGMLAHAGVKNWLFSCAAAAGIPFQREVLVAGTTDASAIQTTRSGVPAGCVSIPTRYVHMPSEMVDFRDVQAAVKLIVSALSGPIDIGAHDGSPGGSPG